MNFVIRMLLPFPQKSRLNNVRGEFFIFYWVYILLGYFFVRIENLAYLDFEATFRFLSCVSVINDT